MEVREAQQEVREVFVGGAVGQTVSGLIWLVSAALGNWVNYQYGILVLAVGGAFIFPLTQLGLKLLGHRVSLSRENPLNGLAMQVAFIIPACLPVIYGTTMYKLNWFYPAFMVVVGAHYLPSVFLYGMKRYALLAAALIGGGVLIGFTRTEDFSTGGWFGAAVLLLFAIEVSKTLDEEAAKAAVPTVAPAETGPQAEASAGATETEATVEAAAVETEERIEASLEGETEAPTLLPVEAPEDVPPEPAALESQAEEAPAESPAAEPPAPQSAAEQTAEEPTGKENKLE